MQPRGARVGLVQAAGARRQAAGSDAAPAPADVDSSDASRLSSRPSRRPRAAPTPPRPARSRRGGLAASPEHPGRRASTPHAPPPCFGLARGSMRRLIEVAAPRKLPCTDALLRRGAARASSVLCCGDATSRQPARCRHSDPRFAALPPRRLLLAQPRGCARRRALSAAPQAARGRQRWRAATTRAQPSSRRRAGCTRRAAAHARRCSASAGGAAAASARPRLRAVQAVTATLRGAER
jgi:hypothetical protein